MKWWRNFSAWWTVAEIDGDDFRQQVDKILISCLIVATVTVTALMIVVAIQTV